MKGSEKQPNKNGKSAEKKGDVKSSNAEYKEAGFEDQPADLSEGTAVAGKGNVSPGRREEVQNQPSHKKGESQMKGYETTDMPREPEQMKEYGERSQYLVTLHHSPEDCQALHKAIEAQGRDFHSKWEWSCQSGNHTGFALVEARKEAEALELVPQDHRGKARAVKVRKFTMEEVSSLRGRQ